MHGDTGRCLEKEGIDFDMIRTGNESSLESANYDIINRNAIRVFEHLDVWRHIQPHAYPLEEIMVDLAPRKPSPMSKRLATIPLDGDRDFSHAALSVSNTKLKQVLHIANPLRKKIMNVSSTDKETLVSFQGGSSKRYSVMVLADGPGNPLLGEAQKRRPAEPCHEIASVLIPRNEYDPDGIVDLYAFGKRVVIFPISQHELQVSFHQMSPQIPSTPLHRTFKISHLIEDLRLRDYADNTGSIQSVLQRVVDLPPTGPSLYTNPRFFHVPLPAYHQGKLISYGCRRQSVDVSGVINSYQIEECLHIAKSIAGNQSPDQIGQAYASGIKSKEAHVNKYCLKTINTAIYERQSLYAITYLNTILFTQLFGRLGPKYYNATEPSIKH